MYYSFVAASVTKGSGASSSSPLDAVAGATGAWSTRKLAAAYAGPCVRVVRLNDNAEQDIGFSGALLDTAALAAFVGAATGVVKTWYDQSGNGRDLAQSSAGGERPTLVASGSLVVAIGSQPCLQFADSQYMVTAGALSTLLTTTAGTLALVARATTVTDANAALYNNHALWCEVTNANAGAHVTNLHATPEAVAYNFDGTVDGAFSAITASVAFHHTWRHASGTISSYLNSSTPSSTASGTTSGLAGVFRVGSSYNTNFGFTGQIAELVAYNTALSSGDLALLAAAMVQPYGISWS